MRMKAFTLIELMVVLLIVGLLISILLPAVNQARMAARAVHAKSMVSTLSDAVYQYRSTEQLDRYPPSLAKTVDIGNPYNAPNQSAAEMPSTDFTVWGAQLLVWALAGADVLGTPGFGRSLDELYALSVDEEGSAHPVHQRIGPFVDISKIDICAINQTPVRITPLIEAAVPAFVDTFNMPILYYKADTTRKFIYQYADNLAFRLASIPKGQAVLDAAILDPRVEEFSGHAGPHNRDSFILISAGRDAEYFTDDDIVNFAR